MTLMEVDLEIPAKPEYIGLVRLLVSSLASGRREIGDERIDDLKLAVSEACTNAIEAHEAKDSRDRVVVHWQESDAQFDVLIDDQGPGFDVDSLPEHPPVTDPERLNFERGLGIPLIRSLVDDVEFQSSSGGTSVRLTMFCGRSKDEEDSEV